MMGDALLVVVRFLCGEAFGFREVRGELADAGLVARPARKALGPRKRQRCPPRTTANRAPRNGSPSGT